MIPLVRLAFGILLLSACISNASASTCLTTLPTYPPFTPPAPQNTASVGHSFWYGNEALWTLLPVNGTWRGLGHYNADTAGYRQKIFWWSAGSDWLAEPKPKLILTARRLDGDAPALATANASSAYNSDIGSAMLLGVDIPIHGCWEITGHYGGHTLSFVVSVEP